MGYHISQLNTVTLAKRIALIPEGLTVELEPACELPLELMTTWNNINGMTSTQLSNTMLKYDRTQTNILYKL